MTEEEVTKILTSGDIRVRTTLDSHERDLVQKLLFEPGLPLLLGMMLGQRETIRHQLQHATVDDMKAAQRLGVLQGHAAAVDILRQNIIDCTAVPTEPKE